ILPWGMVQTVGVATQDFATYGTNGITPFTNYVSSLAAAGPTSVVRLVTGETMTANKTIGALISIGTIGGPTITQNNFTLTVAGGAIMQTNGNTTTFNGGTVDFGPSEGVLMVGPNGGSGAIAINSVINGTGGLTITNGGASNPGIQINAANNYTGGTFINN